MFFRDYRSDREDKDVETDDCNENDNDDDEYIPWDAEAFWNKNKRKKFIIKFVTSKIKTLQLWRRKKNIGTIKELTINQRENLLSIKCKNDDKEYKLNYSVTSSKVKILLQLKKKKKKNSFFRICW